MRLGNLEIQPTATLAPMAGVADRAFRELCVQWGAACVTSEMASAKGLVLGGGKTAELLYLSEKERPAGIQLFGDDPATMAKAACIAMQFSPDFIDINMGCPAPKVAGNGGGAALMKRPQLAAEITHAVVQAVDVPVTVKLRKGWDETTPNAPELALLCQQAGAAAITIHGRTRTQMYAPPVDIESIRQVKQAVHIPVIANGDIFTPQAAAEMYRTTGCDLVAIGRGAQGRPWLFGQVRHFLATGELLPEPPLPQRLEIMLEHIAQLCAYKGEACGMRQARKHVAWYLTGLRGAAAFRRMAGGLNTLDDVKALAAQVLRECTE